MAHILIIRFSAIGDVAMTVPVIDSLARQYPDDQFTVVSQSFLSSLFDYCPVNVTFTGVDLKNEYKGIPGMYRLYRELKKVGIDKVADLHDVLRTKLLRIFFRCSGIQVKYINKGRKEKHQLTRKKNKICKPLKSSVERYADVFAHLGMPVRIDFRSLFPFDASKRDITLIKTITGEKTGTWIGVAPFAKHKGKIYPLEDSEQVVAYFSGRPGVKVFLFGGGREERNILEEWEQKYPQTVSVAGKTTLANELLLISFLDVMFSMDSANMHLASLTATPVVSFWGATHPYAGFYGYNQLPGNAVQSQLPCRPCSVYGNQPCYRKDYACIAEITPQMIIEKMERAIS